MCPKKNKLPSELVFRRVLIHGNSISGIKEIKQITADKTIETQPIQKQARIPTDVLSGKRPISEKTSPLTAIRSAAFFFSAYFTQSIRKVQSIFETIFHELTPCHPSVHKKLSCERLLNDGLPQVVGARPAAKPCPQLRGTSLRVTPCRHPRLT